MNVYIFLRILDVTEGNNYAQSKADTNRMASIQTDSQTKKISMNSKDMNRARAKLFEKLLD